MVDQFAETTSVMHMFYSSCSRCLRLVGCRQWWRLALRVTRSPPKDLETCESASAAGEHLACGSVEPDRLRAWWSESQAPVVQLASLIRATTSAMVPCPKWAALASNSSHLCACQGR
eukprot:6240146-Amphidinium_carterae.1